MYYLVRTSDGSIDVSSAPDVDAHGDPGAAFLEPALPYFIADAWRRRLGAASSPQVFLRRTRRLVRRYLPGRSVRLQRAPGDAPADTDWSAIAGRRLSERQLVARLWRQPAAEASLGQPRKLLQAAYLNGALQRDAALAWCGGGTFACALCGYRGAADWAPCAYCGEARCPTCPDCRPGVRGCEAIYARRAEPPVALCVRARLDFALTQAQRDVQSALLAALRAGEEAVVLWAACGAGKTEVALAAIEAALAAGRRALYAVPRRDICREIGARLRSAFPEVDCAVLYGGSGERFDPGLSLIAATTHQAARLYGHFGLIILDEFDAFPYEGNAPLQAAVARAAEPGAFWLRMSATAGGRSRAERVIELPARHHGRPLPLPEWRQVRGAWPESWVAERRARLAAGRRLLLFAASRERLRQATAQARERLHPRAQGVHAQSADRHDLIDAFRAGRIPVLAATTLLERGVTFDRLDVAVLDADADLFDAPALIQMAGRVDRRAADAGGEVWFLSSRRTPAMKRACAQIERLNRLAAERGYLRG